jgi:hypothetical protein
LKKAKLIKNTRLYIGYSVIDPKTKFIGKKLKNNHPIKYNTIKTIKLGIKLAITIFTKKTGLSVRPFFNIAGLFSKAYLFFSYEKSDKEINNPNSTIRLLKYKLKNI